MNELRGLWHGKSYDPEEWIEGYYVGLVDYDTPGILSKDDGDIYDVDPATLGECTGLRDKNGTPIFEGDILHFVNTYCNANTEWLCAVEFHDGDFICRYLEEDGHLGEYIHFGSWNCPKVVWDVCGNIHDNPELTKVRKGNE